jgi:heme A synthase
LSLLEFERLAMSVVQLIMGTITHNDVASLARGTVPDMREEYLEVVLMVSPINEN